MRNFSAVKLATVVALALGSTAALAAPVKLTATLSGAGGAGDPDGSGAFAVDADPDLGDFCYTLNLSKLGKVTGAAVQGAASPDPLIKLDVTGASTDLCIAAEPSVLKPIVENPAGYVLVVKTTDFPAGAVQGALAKK